MSSHAPKLTIKSVLVGDTNSGKSCIMKRYVNNKFEPNYKQTIGADFLTKEVTQDGTQIKSQIWDTAGQERFRSLAISYYRDADVFIFVYDSTKTASFDYIKSVIDDPAITGCKDPIKVLVANKSDLNNDNQVVSCKTAKQFKEEHQFQLFIEVSASKGTNIDELFTEIHRLVLQKKARLHQEVESVPAIHPALQPFLPKIESYQGKLQRQIESCVRYPNEDRKQRKIDAWDALKTAKSDWQTALATVQQSYPDFLKGRRTQKLIKEIDVSLHKMDYQQR